MKYNRIFVIVMDSVGVGSEPDAHIYGDEGSNTLKHIAETCNGITLPNLEKLGLGDLTDIKGVSIVEHPNSFSLRLRETSVGKDTLTGHWEMMGIETKKPFMTFTDTGFPKELIAKLEQKTGHKVIGNISASGTEIIKDLGEEQMRDNSLIVYTSADSVLQIAASEEVTGVQELYRCCEIAREICMKPEWMVGRVIARPFIGKTKDTFVRTPNRHDLAVKPPLPTVMSILQEHRYDVNCIGKINDIFDGEGVTKTQKTTSNEDGMEKTILEAKNDFKGICFVNLVDFDAKYGHRRDAKGYKDSLERFDKQLGELIKYLKDDDLLLITADHGNDPTWTGTDHTREKVPLLMYSPAIITGAYLPERDSFADIGATILYNFEIIKPDNLLGTKIKEVF